MVLNHHHRLYIRRRPVPWTVARHCSPWMDVTAYFAAHPHIWRTFRAGPYMVGNNGQVDQGKLKYPGGHKEPHLAHVYERQTRALMDSTVFPSVAKPIHPVLADRIRSVTDMDQHFIFPFVVVDGHLYLASLVENESSFDPNKDVSVDVARVTAGIESFWGRKMSVAVKGGLVCVPYPSHLVHQLAFGDLGWPPNFPETTNPWLFVFPVDQVWRVQFHSCFNMHEIHRQLTPHYTAIVDWDFANTTNDYCATAFPPDPTRLHIFRQNHDYDINLPRAIALRRNLTHIEILGEGYFDPSWTAHVDDDEWNKTHSMFNLPNLQHLTLDYFISSSGGDFRRSFGAIHLPCLRFMCLAFDISDCLFESDHVDTILPPQHKGRIAFPCLTHLTLVAYPSHPGDLVQSRVELYPIPRLPLAHMPKLTHLHVPCEHVGFSSRHCIEFEQLADWAFQFTHLTSLRISGVSCFVAFPPASAKPFTFPLLIDLGVDLRLFFRCPDIARLMVTPNLQRITIHAGKHDLPRTFLASCTKLESVTVDAFEFMPPSWVTLAALPNLSTLAITSNESQESCGTFYHAVEHDDVQVGPEWTGKLLAFPKLESLSYTMSHGSLDLNSIAFDNVRRVSLGMEHARVTSFLSSPQLHKLQVSVSLGLCLETLQAIFCPRMEQVFAEFISGPVDPIVRCVDWCQTCANVSELVVLHFTGAMGNRASWRALRDTAPVVACALAQQAVVTVRFAEMEVKGRDLELVADALFKVFVRDGDGDSGKGKGAGLEVRLEVVTNEDGVEPWVFAQGLHFAKLRASGVQVQCKRVAIADLTTLSRVVDGEEERVCSFDIFI